MRLLLSVLSLSLLAAAIGCVGSVPTTPPAPSVPTPSPAPVPSPTVKRTLYFISQSGCLPCVRMLAVLQDPRVTPQLVRFDLKQIHDGMPPPFIGRVRGYPTLVIADGEKELSRRVGSLTPGATAAWLAQY